MAVTENLYTGDGSTVLYSFTFEYLNTADIKVSLDDVDTTAYSIVNATQLQLNTAPASGVAIRIYRVTSDASLQAEFFPGSAIKSSDLNNNFTQSLYVAQETNRTASKATTVADSAKTAADSAVTTANTASTTASNAVTTANSAVTTANSAVSTANTASTTASSAVTTANNAAAVAEAASTAVASAVFYVSYANVAAIPSNPSNGDLIEVTDSTGIESFTPLAGLPSGFTGATGLAVRLTYTSVSSTWTYAAYRAIDPESRYISVDSSSFSNGLSVSDGTASAPSLAFTSDTNTGIYRPGADQLAISTGGNGRVFIGSSGKVGINVTDPDWDLQVDNFTASGSSSPRKLALGAKYNTSAGDWDNLKLNMYRDGNTAANNYGFTVSAATLEYHSGGGVQTWYNAGAEKMRLTGDRLGLGTSTPATAFEINNSSVTQFRITNGTNIFDILNDGSNSVVYSAGPQFNRISGTNPVIWQYNNGSNEAMRIAGSVVGIGTTNPSYALDIASADTTSGIGYALRLRQNATAGAAAIQFTDNPVTTQHGWIACDSSSNLKFATGLSERMRIDSSGNVGVGESSPSAKLHVEGSDDANNLIVGHNNTNFAVYHDSTIGEVRLKAEDGSGNNFSKYFAFYTHPSGSAATERMRINSAGNIGVGTTAASSRLHVVGSGTNTTETVAEFGNQTIFNGLQVVTNGNLDWGFNALNSRNLTFHTNQAERMRINSSGNIGIGTSVPSSKLHIESPAAASGRTDTSILLTTGGSYGGKVSGFINQGVDAGLAFNTINAGVDAERMVISSGTGNIGINTSSPTNFGTDWRTLELKGGIQGGVFRTSNTASGGVIADFYTAGSWGAVLRTATNHPLVFQTNLVEKMRIDASGRVGINTSAPQAQFHVDGDVEFGALNTQTIPNVTSVGGCRVSWNYDAGAAETDFWNLYHNANKSFVFHQKTGNTTAIDVAHLGKAFHRFFIQGSEKVHFSTYGVGINNASPSYALDVSSTDTTAGKGYALRLRHDTTANAAAIQFTNNGATFEHGWIASDSSSNLKFATGSVERFRVTSTGSILISQSSSSTPGYQNTNVGAAFENAGTEAALFLSRAQYCPFFINVNANGYAALFSRSGSAVGSITITTTSTAFNTSSDYRLKENIVDIADGITRVKQLKPSRFNFIADTDTTVDGFVAHEVQDIVPEAITGEKDAVDDDGNAVYQGIDQSKLVPLLTAALQEAIAKIEILETKVSALEAN